MLDLDGKTLFFGVVGLVLLASAFGSNFSTVMVPSLTGGGFDIHLLDNQYLTRDSNNQPLALGAHLWVNGVDLGKLIVGYGRDAGEIKAEGGKVLYSGYQTNGFVEFPPDGDYSFPVGQNEFVQNSAVGLDARFLVPENNLGFSYAGVQETLYLKNQKVFLSKTFCPRLQGSETVYAQVFDGSKSKITLADFKQPVKFFCFSVPAIETLPSGNAVNNPLFYADLALKGETTIPPGETVTMFAIVDGSALPQFCPEGQAKDDSGACVAPDITLEEPALSFKAQTTPECASSEHYDENAKVCVNNALVPEENYTSDTGFEKVLDASKGNDYCQAQGPQYVFKDGKCITNYQVLQTPYSIQGASSGGLPSSVAGFPLWVVVAGVAVLIGAWYFYTQKK